MAYGVCGCGYVAPDYGAAVVHQKDHWNQERIQAAQAAVKVPTPESVALDAEDVLSAVVTLLGESYQINHGCNCGRCHRIGD